MCKHETDFQGPLGFDTPFRGVYPERVEGLQGTQPALSPERLDYTSSSPKVSKRVDQKPGFWRPISQWYWLPVLFGKPSRKLTSAMKWLKTYEKCQLRLPAHLCSFREGQHPQGSDHPVESRIEIKHDSIRAARFVLTFGQGVAIINNPPIGFGSLPRLPKSGRRSSEKYWP